jgi:hypothetical protein
MTDSHSDYAREKVKRRLKIFNLFSRSHHTHLDPNCDAPQMKTTIIAQTDGQETTAGELPLNGCFVDGLKNGLGFSMGEHERRNPLGAVLRYDPRRPSHSSILTFHGRHLPPNESCSRTSITAGWSMCFSLPQLP